MKRLLCLLVLMAMIMSATYAEMDYKGHADQLNTLGLLSGTSAGYELDRAPTRVEGIIMLVRLLGKTEEAELQNYKHPFSDVPAWANASVGYAYKMGLTKGISEETFGSQNKLDGNAYASFILRALNYDDSKGDFDWKNALLVATEKGIISVPDKDQMMQQFNRNEMVGLSYNALKAPLKGQSRTLIVHLVQRGAVSEEMALKMKLLTENQLKKPKVTFTIKGYGDIVAELYPEMAPQSVNNFLSLAESGFYNGLTFHRVIEGFMIQGGCPLGNGTGGPGYSIKGEFTINGVDNPLSHTKGVLSMARAQSFDTAGSQFFIVHKPATFLDGQYAAFGKVISGLSIIDQIASVKTDLRDKPVEPVVIEKVTVDRNGYETGVFDKLKNE